MEKALVLVGVLMEWVITNITLSPSIITMAHNHHYQITYVFAFHDGQPVALVDQSRDGGPRLTETQNNEVKSNFAEIAE